MVAIVVATDGIYRRISSRLYIWFPITDDGLHHHLIPTAAGTEDDAIVAVAVEAAVTTKYVRRHIKQGKTRDVQGVGPSVPY